MDAYVIHLFGGHADSTRLEFSQPVQTYDMPTKEGDRHPPKRAFTRYRISDAWSKHFQRNTFIPDGHPGLPPKREMQTA